MFWHQLSAFILKNRGLLLAVVVLVTAVLGWQATQVRLSYELAKILPSSDADFRQYETFKARFGPDGNVMVVGVETDRMYERAFFTDWHELNQAIRRIDGVKDVVSNASLFGIIRDDSLQRFRLVPIVQGLPTTQAQVDSIRSRIGRLPFYQGLVSDSSGRAHLMAITFDQRRLNTRSRIDMVRRIKAQTEAFSARTGAPVHLSGMPYIRTEFTAKVSNELIQFMLLAVAVTGLILAFFFRSLTVVLTTLFVVGVGVVWSVGYMVLFGYQITLLTGLIPPLLIVIGVPNAIFLLNRYHEELTRREQAEPRSAYAERSETTRLRALRTAAEKVGETTFFANVTTSIGFFVFYFTSSPLLLEFGLVAALGVMSTYALSLLLIPILFSYLPTPSPRQRSHLNRQHLTGLLHGIDRLVHTRRWAIYAVIAVATVAGLAGLLRIRAVGYVVDDLPQHDPIYTDLKFFERRFRGVLPFEVAIDAGQPGRALSPTTLTKIRQMQRLLASYPEFARPISTVEAVKFFYQAYRGGDPRYYVLPPALELSKLAAYAPQLKAGKNAGGAANVRAYVDSSRQHTRVSVQMADVGTVRTNALLAELRPRIDSIFNVDRETGQRLPPAERYVVQLTGNSVVFTLGNDYLLRNLQESTALAIGLISVILMLLLRDVRLSLIAILPSLVPLLVTAGIMGYAGIHLKPSTILIFSIAFGISSDGTIYFITKYRDCLRSGRSTAQAISETIRHTGVSMFYTAIILFAGFAIFAASTFQGTQALGMLVSITLLMGMASNLILLPAFLLTVDHRRRQRSENVGTKRNALSNP